MSMVTPFPSLAYQDIAEEEVLGRRIPVYQKRPHDLRALLQESVTRHGQHTCLVLDEVRWTFADFARYIDSVAAELQQRWNISSGERVAILLNNRLKFAVAYYATVTTGAIAVVLNARCKAPELTFMLRDSEPRVLITEPMLYKEVSALLERVPTLEAVVICADADTIPAHTLSFDMLMQASKKPLRVDIAEDDVATMFWLMLHSPNFARYDLSTLRAITYGGSPAPVELLEQLS